MKMILEVSYGVVFAILAYSTAKSDIKEGVIYNKTLLIITGIVLGLDILYYGVFGRNMFLWFVGNFVVVTTISFALYFLHMFAGGDCKLLILLALLYPAKYYLTYNGNYITLYLAVVVAILYGYIYLILMSLYTLLRGENKISAAYVKNCVCDFLKSFVMAFLYMGILNFLLDWISYHIFWVGIWSRRVMCLLVAYFVNRNKYLRRWYMVCAVVIAMMLLIIFAGTDFFAVDVERYVLVILLLLCQMMAKTGLYETIQVKKLKKGMILSSYTSMLLQNSRVRGLPGVSMEDLRNRLSETEVASVKRWAASRKVEEIVVVKKIPFAIFLLMGFATYFIVWSLLI